MNPWEAKVYGLVDGVIDYGKAGLVAPIADATPPPKTRVWDLWKVEGSRKAEKNLPTEHKMLQNGGYTGGEANDKEQGGRPNAPVGGTCASHAPMDCPDPVNGNGWMLLGD
ncbi:hypothetical protein F3Y22_tig00112738pilonHSYRG00345 [Hibiscus syriacus]|uniref:Uncharacterized protein n=1 Tax=Hibiscus syriacus TaxID=106335 RepID=A0A6A2Y6L6_HIBSY|nr:hypothetical protein F3Y22_tig00112738pilonHSYRG00345 [Hibiscus syriacus]